MYVYIFIIKKLKLKKKLKNIAVMFCYLKTIFLKGSEISHQQHVI